MQTIFVALDAEVTFSNDTAMLLIMYAPRAAPTLSEIITESRWLIIEFYSGKKRSTSPPETPRPTTAILISGIPMINTECKPKRTTFSGEVRPAVDVPLRRSSMFIFFTIIYIENWI